MAKSEGPKLKKLLSTPTKFTITLSKTLQVAQYEPVSATISEEHEFNGDPQDLPKAQVRAAHNIGIVLQEFIETEHDRYVQVKSDV